MTIDPRRNVHASLRRLGAAWAATLLLASGAPAHAFTQGQGSDTCAGCHGNANAGLTVRVTANGSTNALTLRQGETLTVALSSSGPTKPTASTGFASAIYGAGGGNPVLLSGGVTGARKLGNYFAHASTAVPNPTFTLAIPADLPAGTYALRSVMLAGNGNGADQNDQWNTGNEIALTIASAAGAPTAPVNVVATAGNGQVSVAFALPGGSAAATSYTATCGSSAASGPASPVVVPNLINGLPVSCRVTATNGAGTSAVSAPSNTVTPNNNPGAPTGVTATAGNQQVTVNFAAPASTGGSAIRSYAASCGTQTAFGAAPPLTVGGLPNGTAVTCTVTATNTANATSAPSAPSNSVTPAGPPGAPAIGNPVAGNGQISVAFTAPASNGSPITGYTATCNDRTAAGSASPIVVSGLANGTLHTCRVTATNAIGTSEPSAAAYASPSAPVATPPSAPVIGTATAGNALITVAFTPPTNAGSAAITSYTATCGTQSATGAASPLTVTGLANGTPYLCRVTATSAAGVSPPSAFSNSVTPIAPPVAATAPAAPVIGTATAGNGQVSVAFAPPGSDGGSAITGYTATCGTQSANGAASPLTVTGLPNGVAVTCRVSATNAIGTGPTSAASASVTPTAPAVAATRPGAPVIGVASAGNAQVSVAFTAPASDGGAAIVGYIASCSAAGITRGTANGPASPLVVTGLTNGTPHTCRVSARNAVGVSPPSADSSSVTPMAPPAAVTRPGPPVIGVAVAGNAQVSVAFAAPASDGGAPIIGYIASCSASGITSGTAAGASPPLTVTGLSNGTAYTCRVSARNSAGVGMPSADSGSVTPVAPGGMSAGRADIVFTSGAPTVNPSTVAPGGQVRLGPVTVFVMKNVGTAPTGPFRFGVYLSTDPTITTADTFLNFASHEFNIAAGAEASFGNVNVAIPPGTPPGNYFIGILADDTNRVSESNENNNYVSAPITIRRP